MRAPAEFQGTVIGDLNRRKGLIMNSEGEDQDVVLNAHVRPPARCIAMLADLPSLCGSLPPGAWPACSELEVVLIARRT